jgi:hypothetical protein
MFVPQEGTANAVVGTLSAVDPDAGETFTFTLASNPNGFFLISGTTLRTAVAISFASYPTVSIQVGPSDALWSAPLHGVRSSRSATLAMMWCLHLPLSFAHTRKHIAFDTLPDALGAT